MATRYGSVCLALKLIASYLFQSSPHTTLRFAQWKRPPDIDSQFIQAIQTWIGPLTTKKDVEFKRDHDIRQNHTVRICELLYRRRIYVYWSTCSSLLNYSQLTTVRYMTPSIAIDFVSHTVQLDACQERKTAGVSRKKGKKKKNTLLA